MKALLALAAATALVATAVVPAVAKPRSESWQVGNDSVHIYYEDLDVNSRGGRAALLARVEKAAHKVCNSNLQQDEDACVRATVAEMWLPALQQAVTERASPVLATR